MKPMPLIQLRRVIITVEQSACNFEILAPNNGPGPYAPGASGL